jgi:hypothetical protein
MSGWRGDERRDDALHVGMEDPRIGDVVSSSLMTLHRRRSVIVPYDTTSET